MSAQYIQDITILSGVLKCKNGLLSGQQWKPSGFRLLGRNGRIFNQINRVVAFRCSGYTEWKPSGFRLLGRNGRIFNQINRVVAFRCSGYTECQVGGKERLLDADFRV